MTQSLLHDASYDVTAEVVDADAHARRRSAASQAAARALVTEHIDFITRFLRYLGVGESELEDAVQSVFVTATLKLDQIKSGSERGFLVAIAHRTAFRCRRTFVRRKEVLDEELLERSDPAAGPDEIAEDRRDREDLVRILQAMPFSLRTVFVLSEIEELEGAEIAELLGVPVGTVASRLRRAREDFRARVERFQRVNERRGDKTR